MKNTIIRTLTSLGLALALTTLANTAHADIVNYSFSGTIDTAGPLLNQDFSGNLSYDDAQTPAPGFESEELLFDLTSFSLNFNGTTYGLGDLDTRFAVVDGQFTGLYAGSALFMFLPASAPFEASFAFDLGQGNAGNASVNYVARDPNPNNVSEPATSALLAVGLLATAARRKARAR